jgi:hypothetical protein
MKKRFIILMAAFLFTITATYANKNDGGVPESVVTEFSHSFDHARNAKWEKIDNYYEVTFSQFGMTLFAFYSEDSDFMGIASYILSDKLPVSLISDLKTKYGNFWITDLFRYSINEKAGYCVTLENGDQKIMLKSDEGQKWYIYKAFKND